MFQVRREGIHYQMVLHLIRNKYTHTYSSSKLVRVPEKIMDL